MCSVLYALCSVLCTIYSVWCTLFRLQFVVSYLQLGCMVYNIQITVSSLLCTVCSVYSVQYTYYSLQCVVCSVQTHYMTELARTMMYGLFWELISQGTFGLHGNTATQKDCMKSQFFLINAVVYGNTVMTTVCFKTKL